MGVDSRCSGRSVLDSIRQQQSAGRVEASSGKRARPDRYELHDVVTGKRMDQQSIIPSRISEQVRRRPAHDCQSIVSKHTVFMSPNGSWTVSPNGSWTGDQIQKKSCQPTQRATTRPALRACCPCRAQLLNLLNEATPRWTAGSTPDRRHRRRRKARGNTTASVMHGGMLLLIPVLSIVT